MIQGLVVNVVRTKFDYEKYIPESYQKKYDYEASKDSLPWFVVSPYKVDDNDGILPNKCNLTFSPEPDFSAVTDDPTGAFTKSEDDKYLICDWDKMNHLLLDVNKEVFPGNTFNGDAEVILFTGEMSNPTAKVTFKMEELDVSECQRIIDLYFNQQGQPTVGKLLNTLATKVFGVTYRTPPIE